MLVYVDYAAGAFVKHKRFALICFALLSLLFTIAGVLAWLGLFNVEVVFWTRSPIESQAGKIAWIVISATCLAIFVALAYREFGKGANGSSG